MARRGVVLLALTVACLAGCSNNPLSLLDGRDHVVVAGKAYRVRVAIAGCGAPVIWVNGKHWRPVRTLGAPFPSSWHTHDSGPHFHQTTYVTGTLRVRHGAVAIELRDGTVIPYEVTTEPYPSNLCA